MRPPEDPPTLPTIPTETFEEILLYLNRNDLCQCVLISREWNRTFTPYLWKTLAIHSLRQIDQFCKNEATQQALQRNASLVHELYLNHKSLYDQFLSSPDTLYSEPAIGDHSVYKNNILTELRTLELRSVVCKKYSFDRDIFGFVRQITSLRRLKISMEMDPSVLARLVTEYIPDLEDLDIDIRWHGDVQELLENLPESIRIFKLRDLRHLATRSSTKSSKLDNANPAAKSVRLDQAKMMRAHHSLESFDIPCSLNGELAEVLIQFFKSCNRTLKTVRGRPFTWSVADGFEVFYTLRSIGFTWTELRQTDLSRDETDGNVATVIALSPWTVVEAHTEWMRPLAINALLENCDYLTELSILGRGRTTLTGVHMQTILSRARHLKIFQAHWLLSAQRISAANILMSQWATTTLEHIDFKIYVPRNFEENDQAVAFEASRNIQRQLLRRLGQQIHFKKLMIGGKLIIPTSGEFVRQFVHQFDCLEFTLETGLDELRNLKKLEVLDIHHMDHRAGVPELEWMVENWPRINLVSGILDSFRPPSKEVKSWIATHQRLSGKAAAICFQ